MDGCLFTAAHGRSYARCEASRGVEGVEGMPGGGGTPDQRFDRVLWGRGWVFEKPSIVNAS